MVSEKRGGLRDQCLGGAAEAEATMVMEQELTLGRRQKSEIAMVIKQVDLGFRRAGIQMGAAWLVGREEGRNSDGAAWLVEGERGRRGWWEGKRAGGRREERRGKGGKNEEKKGGGGGKN